MSAIDLSKLYKEMQKEMQKEMLHQLKSGASAFIHPGTKGDNSEMNWIQWFRAYLPKRYSVRVMSLLCFYSSIC